MLERQGIRGPDGPGALHLIPLSVSDRVPCRNAGHHPRSVSPFTVPSLSFLPSPRPPTSLPSLGRFFGLFNLARLLSSSCMAQWKICLDMPLNGVAAHVEKGDPAVTWRRAELGKNDLLPWRFPSFGTPLRTLDHYSIPHSSHHQTSAS